MHCKCEFFPSFAALRLGYMDVWICGYLDNPLFLKNLFKIERSKTNEIITDVPKRRKF